MRVRYLAIGVVGFTAVHGVHAHHSYSEYDDQRTVELEGKLLDVAWQNPHVRFMVEAVDASDRVVVWDIESTSLNALRRMQVPLDLLAIGSNVKFAGWPSKQANNRIYATNLQSPGGQEVVLWRYSTPRWASTALGVGSEQAEQRFQSGVANEATSLFRVWATNISDVAGLSAPFQARLRLTESATRAAAEFDPVSDTVTQGCTPKGMPIVMYQPPPMEFVDEGERILLRTEEYDSVRVIHMRDAGNAAAQPKSLLGFSTGRWDGKTLVVETSRVSAQHLNPRGAPLGPSATFVERFTPSADGSRLDYTIVITDPDSLTEPVTISRYWVWRPGEQVLPFNCGQRVAQ